MRYIMWQPAVRYDMYCVLWTDIAGRQHGTTFDIEWHNYQKNGSGPQASDSWTVGGWFESGRDTDCPNWRLSWPFPVPGRKPIGLHFHLSQYFNTGHSIPHKLLQPGRHRVNTFPQEVRRNGEEKSPICGSSSVSGADFLFGLTFNAAMR